MTNYITSKTTTDVCYDIVNGAKEFLGTIIERVPDKRHFVLCDYGSGDGKSSLTLFKQIIQSLHHKFDSDTEVSVIYQDLPQSDFTQIFHQSLSLKQQFTSVYPLCSGGDFFKQCLPSNSVHIGICFTCLHYLSISPGILDDTLLHLHSNNELQKQSFTQQAKVDWEMFLMSRSKELTPGGQLIIGSYVVTKDGQFTTKPARAKKSAYECLHDCWYRMYTEGHITQIEYSQATFDQYIRSVDEYLEPLLNTQSQLYQSGLRLQAHTIKVLQDPCYQKFLSSSQSKGDASIISKSYTDMRRTWNSHYFTKSLSNQRGEDDKVKLLDILFGYYENEIVKHPHDQVWDIVMLYLHVYKIETN